MLVEIWSDVVCPWCYIGKRRFEQALTAFARADDVEVVYRSFELDPSAPVQPTETVLEALGRKYGGGPGRGRQMVEQVAQVAAELGLRFDHAGAPHTSTTDAHRLLHHALAEGGPQLQARLNEALLQAYFSHARSMADPEVLAAAAVSVGLDRERVLEVLGGDEHAEAVRADLDQARAFGISGVPFFVVDRRYGVSGAQATEVFTALLEQADADDHPRLQVMADGTVCGPDGCAVPSAG
ncbi:MAG: 2-hydroxychromene-2-carboxylate isomerase/DsbA-like thioredoxin domain [uncultured Nocardioidaceae bacterium]|uniref:2-hydroxychromene-2-carboxylate isomerase/DsbA-like thioredoxin domain n=1 Tax=uncultured Nocardioidaceae bacterium TaxID=253824 RepID=A0A6J4L8Z8_9ACTN|nr:MAG: 2-hydroxychromene-2-carboxylate isomerase/DsbA-like thioredoxin domain [uncultured Nocardioidaceae bacterium]